MHQNKISGFKLILLSAIFLAGLISQVHAAVTIDSRKSGGAADSAGLASLTWSHTVGTGTNRALLVGVSTATTTALAGLPANRVLNVTYNSIALTRIGTIVSANTLNSSELFMLVNPPAGTANVVVTFNLTPTPSVFVNQALGSSISFFNVSQTNPTGAFVSATGTNNAPTVNVTDSLTGDFVFDSLAAPPNAGFFVAGANQTVCTDEADITTCNRGRSFFNNSYDVGASSTEPGASPFVTMSWGIGNADNWALGAVAVKQLGVTSATVSVSGRVSSSPNGRGIARAQISITTPSGVTRTAQTNAFGYYRFKEVASGETYIFNVAAKNRSFSSQIVTVNDELTELNFYPQP